MATPAELQAWRDALEDARFSGTKVAEVGDYRVEYKTDAEMRRALADLDRRIAAATATPVKEVRIYSTKGL